MAEIENLFRVQDYLLPDLSQSRILQTTVRNNKITGVGLIQPIYEVIVALDLSQPRENRVHDLQELLIAGRMESEKQGIDQWHAFVDHDFGQLLEKHFGFKKCKGEALILNLR